MDTIARSKHGPLLLVAILTSKIFLSFQQDVHKNIDFLDGYPELPDCSDEMGCKCSTKTEAVGVGNYDSCPLKLSPYTNDPTVAYDARGYGYLHVRFIGIRSAPLCAEKEPEYYINLASRRCSKINVTEIKNEEIFLETVEIADTPIIPVEYWAIWRDPTKLEEFSLVDSCPTNKVLRVKCPDFDYFNESPVNGTELLPSYSVESTDRQQRLRLRLRSGNLRRSVNSSLSDPQLIVGGFDAPEGKWPFVGILVRNGKYFCMVVVIDREWVLTAAHCIFGMQSYYYEVVLGKFRRLAMSPYEQTYRVVGYKHIGFDYESFNNDIALLKLATPIVSNRWVRYATLTKTDPKFHDRCFIAGWGALEFQKDNQILSHKLKMAELRIMNCTERKGAKGVVCAGDLNYSKDSCQGDSGGPLVCQQYDPVRDETSWVLAGLVSYGFECARVEHTGGYTSIAYHLNWIKSVIAGSDGQELVETVDAVPSRCQIRNTSRPCPILRCRRPLGAYLDEDKICNGERELDCLYGEDEQHCDYSRDPPLQILNNPYANKIQNSEVTTLLESPLRNVEEFPPSELESARCDHCPHLLDYSDEENCTLAQLGCQTPNQIPCPFGSGCLERSERCSAKNVCKDGGGEIGCVFLSKEENVVLDRFDLALPSFEGFPYVLVNGEWEILCAPDDTTQASLQLLADITCQYLGYKRSREVHSTKKIKRAPTVVYNRGTYVYSRLHALQRRRVSNQIPSNIPDDETLHGDLFTSGTRNIESLFHYARKTNRSRRQADESCLTMLVSCHVPLNGKVRMQMFNPNASVHHPGAMPWRASVYSNEKFLCSATLVLNRWAIASGNCSDKYNLTTDNVQVVLGTNCAKPRRKGRGPYEETVRVVTTYIYSKRRHRVALLKLEKEPTRTLFVNSLHWGANPPLRSFSVCATMWQQNIIELVPYNCTSNTLCLKRKEKDEIFHKIDELSLVACRANKTSFETWWAAGLVVPGTNIAFSILNKEDYNAVINTAQKHTGDKAEDVNKTVKLDAGNDGSISFEQPFNTDGGATVKDQTLVSNGGLNLLNMVTVNEVGDGVEYLPCFHTSCPVGKFQCFSSKCIDIGRVRDGQNDCPDGEDEEDEQSLHCLRKLMHTNCAKFCDGYIDCPSNGIDEKYCGCPPNMFRCYKSPEMKGPKKCIQKNQVCDRCKNCDGGEDEQNCYTLAMEFRNQENVLGVWPTQSHGYILLRTCGRWNTVPADKWTKTLSYATCNKIGLGTFIKAVSHEVNITAKAINDNLFRRFNGYMGRNAALDTKIRPRSSSTISNITNDVYKIVYLKCGVS
ncbi:uncharacterized protein LOC143036459 [Oratosquilla oratoria]|uniref:uncharacterized protein LOC143036459 n=1 Tax=Oratosquilla oratoria TaxID=337810 RepID=UPI003F773BEB